jgi:5'-nucleotidase
VGVEPPRRMSNAELIPKEKHENAFTMKIAWRDTVELPSNTDGSLVESGWVSLSYLTRLQESSRDDLGAAEAGLTSLLG